LTLEQVEAAGLRGVESDMRGIGEMARASGLSVSALRFHDGAGVLVPAEVDPATGYRRYADHQIRSARLVAGLRRVGMPVAEIARAMHNPSCVREILEHHRRRLATGYADAQRELSRIQAMLDLEERLMTRVTLTAAALAACLDAVRFAASTAADLPALAGVLVETDADALLVMATDRYRLASVRVPAAVDGPPARVVLPMPFVDEVRPQLAGDEPVTLELDAGLIRLGVAEATPVDADYPDLRRVLESAGDDRRAVAVDAAALGDAVTTTPGGWREQDGLAYEISVLGLDSTGALRVVAEAEWAADADAHVAVNREFLLQALDAGGAGQLLLELDGPIKPLVVRGEAERFSLLMPVRY
jgi:DNA-binding transcriptional MerR regulator